MLQRPNAMLARRVAPVKGPVRVRLATEARPATSSTVAPHVTHSESYRKKSIQIQFYNHTRIASVVALFKSTPSALRQFHTSQLALARKRRGGDDGEGEEREGPAPDEPSKPALPHMQGLPGGFVFDTKGKYTGPGALEPHPDQYELEEKILAKQRQELKKFREMETPRQRAESQKAQPKNFLDSLGIPHYDETLDWRSLKFNPDQSGYIDDDAADWNRGDMIAKVRRDPPAYSEFFHKLIARAINGRRYNDAFQLFLDMFDEQVPRYGPNNRPSFIHNPNHLGGFFFTEILRLLNCFWRQLKRPELKEVVAFH